MSCRKNQCSTFASNYAGYCKVYTYSSFVGNFRNCSFEILFNVHSRLKLEGIHFEKTIECWKIWRTIILLLNCSLLKRNNIINSTVKRMTYLIISVALTEKITLATWMKISLFVIECRIDLFDCMVKAFQKYITKISIPLNWNTVCFFRWNINIRTMKYEPNNGNNNESLLIPKFRIENT